MIREGVVTVLLLAPSFCFAWGGEGHQIVVDRNGDRGGNKRLVFFLNRREAVSLRMVWDTLIIREMVSKQKIAAFADGLDREIAAKQRKEWSLGTPEQWANQSHHVAAEKVYADVPEDGPPPKLGHEYVDSKIPVLAEQLQRGGTRLARMLNIAFQGAP